MVKFYLGDSVYADTDEYGRLVLTTEDGVRVSNRIILEPEVEDCLLSYIKARKAEK